jgi:hypothetical protein
MVTATVVVSGDWEPQGVPSGIDHTPKRSVAQGVRIRLPEVVRDIMDGYMLYSEELVVRTRLVTLGGITPYFGTEVEIPTTKKRGMRPLDEPFTRLELAILFTVHNQTKLLRCDPPEEVAFDLIFADRQQRVRNQRQEFVSGRAIMPL